jgi:hypothetical protein
LESKEQWHLKKEINISHLVTTFVAIASFFFWIQSIETRIAVLEHSDKMFMNSVHEIKATLIRIEQKIDRKADK